MKIGVFNIIMYFTAHILTLCWTTDAYCCNKLVLQQTANVQSQLKKEGTTYVVKYEFDLKGAEITVPNDCKLYFQGGSFKNGIIKGSRTEIIAEKVRILEKVTLYGSWSNKKVYSQWLDFVEGKKVDNVSNFRNLMLLCAGDDMTHLYMQKGVFYCSVITESSNIIVPSNVYWHNSATLCQLPTDSPKYSFVLLHKSNNVTIDGGEFVGDVQTHTGTDGEWGHGIKVAGATNVVLKNFVSREFWGDGIDLIEADYVSSIKAGVGPCDGITINNVKCLYNRRQGLSIEAAKNVEVKNSEFAYTGKYKMTEPGCGLDIEPWCKNEEKIYNIRVTNCNVHDNNPQRDFCIESNLVYWGNVKSPENTPSNYIIVKNSKLGRLHIQGANTVVISNCDIDDIMRCTFSHNIDVSESVIRGTSGVRKAEGLKISKRKK